MTMLSSNNALPSVSVVVPTRNRCQYLSEVIQSIRTQDFPSHLLETLLVDNGSTDKTREVVARINQESSRPIQYVFEPRPGVHNAVNRGVLEASKDIVVIVDDDLVFRKDYLRNLVSPYKDKNITCTGGKVVADWENGIVPAWIEEYTGPFSIDYGAHRRLIQWPERLRGASLSSRRWAFLTVGGWNPSRKHGGDGEDGFCRKIFDAGGHIMWVPEAVVWHRLSARTVTPKWMLKRAFEQGRCNAYTRYRDKRSVSAERIGNLFLRAAICLFRSYVRLILQKNHRPDQWKASRFLTEGLYDIEIMRDRDLRAFVMKDDHISALKRKPVESYEPTN